MSRESSIQGNARRRLRRVYLTLTISVVLLIGTLLWVLHVCNKTRAKHAPMVEAAMEFELEITKSHLWFEEILSGDRDENIEDVWKYLDEADWYAQAMLEGGSNSKGIYLPLDDDGLRRKVETARAKLEDFKDLTQMRWDAKEESVAGSDIDQQYDALFRGIVRLADDVETEVNEIIASEVRKLKRTQLFVIFGSVLFAIFIAMTVHRYTVCPERAEEAMRLSEEKFRGIFESSADAVMLLDNSGFFDCNEATLRIFGYDSKEEFCSKHPGDLSPPTQPDGSDSTVLADQRMATAWKEGKNHFEWMHRRTDGSDFSADVLLTALHIGGTTALHAVVRDISEQKEAEQRLQASEEKLRTMSEAALDAVIMMDSSGKAMHWNPAAERMFGYSVEEILGRDLHSVLTPARYRQEAASGLAQFMKSGQGKVVGQVLELQALRKDQSEFPIEISVAPIRIDGLLCAVAVVRDITERRQVEDALQESSRELQAIYEGMADGLLIADIETRRFVRANHAICEMLGYSEDALLSMSVTDIHPASDVSDALGKFEKQAQGRLPIAVDLPVQRRDGSVFYADITTNRLVYGGRECNIGFFRDITQRKQAHDALQREHQTLRQLLKSHDHERRLIAYEIHDGLAQQLAGLIMQVQIIEQQKTELPQIASDACGKVFQSLRECLAETRRLISGVRPPILDESGVLTALQDLVFETLNHDGPTIQFESRVQFDRLEPVLENGIYRIVQESLTNACRHSKSDKVLIELSQEGENVRIVVQDWGIGFDSDTVDEKRYGLVGIRERARLLGGHTTVNSSPGEGTTVVVTLPLALREQDE